MNLNLSKLIDELTKLRQEMVSWDSEEGIHCAITSIEVKECDPSKDQYADVLIIKTELTENAKLMKTGKGLAAQTGVVEIPLDADKKPTTLTLTKTSKIP